MDDLGAAMCSATWGQDVVEVLRRYCHWLWCHFQGWWWKLKSRKADMSVSWLTGLRPLPSESCWQAQVLLLWSRRPGYQLGVDDARPRHSRDAHISELLCL